MKLKWDWANYNQYRRELAKAGLLFAVIIAVPLGLMMYLGNELSDGGLEARETDPWSTPSEYELQTGNQVGELAPEYFFEDIDGAVFGSEGLQDKIVVVMATPTACEQCIAEARSMVALWETEGQRDDVQFITISMHPEDTLEEVQAFRSEHSIGWPIIETQKAFDFLTDFEVSTPATTIIINKHGTIVYRDAMMTSPNTVREYLQEYR